MVADARFDKLSTVRSTIATGLAPVYWLGNAPYEFTDWVAGLFENKQDLQEENEDLRARLLILERRALKYAALASENNELRRLMNSSEVLDDRVIVGEVVGVSPDPFSHEIIINKGRSDGLSPGQAILDAHGLMGQVVQSSQITSRVLLVSDSSHAVPVEVVRNGLRAILLGTGDTDTLDLVHVPDTADIREGDLLVSSGGVPGCGSQPYFQGTGRTVCFHRSVAQGAAEPEPSCTGGIPAGECLSDRSRGGRG